MLEYASMRLTFVCVTAVTFPTVIVSAAPTQRSPVQLGAAAPSAPANTRAKAAKPAAFTPTAMNAVTAVGAPS